MSEQLFDDEVSATLIEVETYIQREIFASLAVST
jgi:hypothetical protein